ncbi:MAG TPA: hypothetical protein PLO05_05365 [Bacteroidales bacterium]|nr:hypothetical protein [Bacteroidales bacterium]
MNKLFKILLILLITKYSFSQENTVFNGINSIKITNLASGLYLIKLKHNAL